MNRSALAAHRVASQPTKPYTVTHSVLSRKTRLGTVKRTPTNCVHQVGARTWEGAHYKDPAKAWRFLQAINAKLGGGA